jgi:hypothetical protein
MYWPNFTISTPDTSTILERRPLAIFSRQLLPYFRPIFGVKIGVKIGVGLGGAGGPVRPQAGLTQPQF